LLAIGKTHVVLKQWNPRLAASTYQLELPVVALHWCLAAFVDRILAAPDEGGLPAGRLSVEGGPFLGESVSAMRTGAALPDGAPPGMSIRNLTRRIGPLPQELIFSDQQLYQEGVWDALCDVVDEWSASQGEAVLDRRIREARPKVF
jgi:hypothetical protein